MEVADEPLARCDLPGALDEHAILLRIDTGSRQVRVDANARVLIDLVSVRSEEPEPVPQNRSTELRRRFVVVTARPRTARLRFVGAGIGELVVRKLHVLGVVGRESV